MVKTRIAMKLFLTYAGLAIICIVTVGIFTTVSLKSYYLERIASHLESNAQLVRHITKQDLFLGNLSDIDSQNKNLGREECSL